MEAKLDLIQKWPEDLEQIRQPIADRSYRMRRWGDVRDIKTAQHSTKQMRESGLRPKELDDHTIVDYVAVVGGRLG